MLKTTDGGQSCALKYSNDDKAYFLDAMDFSDKKHGLIFGDPIDKKFLLLEINDGGDSWHKLENLPDAEEGEAAFAASGTCLRLRKDGSVGFVTGGKVARLISSDSKYRLWVYQGLPFNTLKSAIIPSDYQSCVENLITKTYLSTGTTATTSVKSITQALTFAVKQGKENWFYWQVIRQNRNSETLDCC